MQIKITLTTDERINLPIAYRHAQQSMIYNALRSCPEYSQHLHNCGTSENTTGFKLFTFSPLMGRYVKIRKRLIFDGSVSFEIRCHDPFMAQLLLSGLGAGKTVTLFHNELTVDECVMENRAIFEETVTVAAVSPITVLSNTSDGHTVYYSPEEEVFYERIIANAKRKWCAIYDENDFSLSISSAGKPFFKLVTQFNGTYVNSWYGHFVLEGNPRVIDFLYNVGLGNKTSQGFGMFEFCDI